MRRSSAPSQVAKRQKLSSDDHEYDDDEDDSGASSGGSGGISRGSTRSRTRMETSNKSGISVEIAPRALPGSARLTTHEDIIRKILSRPFRVPIDGYAGKTKYCKPLKDPLKRALHSPDDENALVLYSPEDTTDVSEFLPQPDENDNPEAPPAPPAEPVPIHVVVDPILCKVLRPHQREGVKFMYDCLTGKKIPNGRGCIMADDMGLGKTLQCITLVWTLLKQGPYGRPVAENAVIVCPSSLVNNWYNEINKWLGSRLQSLPIDGGTREEIKAKLNTFMGVEATGWLAKRKPQEGTPQISVLIISYETFRLYADILQSKKVGMVLCDEGHRLKNSQSQTFQALNELKTTRRIILSGTPIQNDLTEYFSLLNFVNPGVLGTSTEFHRKFEIPLLRARDSMATEEEQKKGQERLSELLALAQLFTIRRTSTILSKYLPVKVDQVVFCRMTEMQTDMYKTFLKSKSIKKVIAGAGTSTLTAITSLKKIANHPALVWDKVKERAEGFEDAMELFPPGFSPQGHRPETSFRPEMSGKFQVLDTMLAWIRSTTTDKIVLVSNYTQTLDMMELMCRARKYGYVRLDGSLGIAKRMKLVERFNDKDSRDFAFLLSSKAGGCGLNLIGANRLVLFDPDWNPANDGQAMARVWRDGQKKKVFIYRMVATGTIEEKIFQRQAHKQSLSSVVVDEEEDVERHFTASDLKDLFTYKENTTSDTHDSFSCERCKKGEKLPKDVRISSNEEGDMAQWHHITDSAEIQDPVLRDSAADIVSMVFSTQSPDPLPTV